MSKYRATQLGVMLETIMFKEKISQGELAKKIGVSQCTISRIIRGQYNHLRNFTVLACKNMPQYFNEQDTKKMELYSQKWMKVYASKLPREDVDHIIEKLLETS